MTPDEAIEWLIEHAGHAEDCDRAISIAEREVRGPIKKCDCGLREVIRAMTLKPNEKWVKVRKCVLCTGTHEIVAQCGYCESPCSEEVTFDT